jgi:hypothetical protein
MSLESKDEMILRLRREGRKIRDIAHRTRTSTNRVVDIIHYGGENKYQQALKLFTEGKSPLEVGTTLSLSSKKTMCYLVEWMRLGDMGMLAKVF